MYVCIYVSEYGCVFVCVCVDVLSRQSDQYQLQLKF